MDQCLTEDLSWLQVCSVNGMDTEFNVDLDATLDFSIDAATPVEVLEEGERFLEALQMRLNDIVRKPNGRFVISYRSGRTDSRPPPKIQ